MEAQRAMAEGMGGEKASSVATRCQLVVEKNDLYSTYITLLTVEN